MRHEPHVQALLDNFIEVARYDLEFDDQQLIEAIIGYHERYQSTFPNDDPKTAAWRRKLIATLKRTIQEIDALE